MPLSIIADLPASRPNRALRTRFLAPLLAMVATAAGAQGGPPMVTDDPDTPGNGNWEINLAAIGQRSAPGWRFTGADADVNYGWGERLQLKVDAPWNFQRQDGTWSSGLGTTQFGVKWRFFDDEKTKWTISTYPQVGFNLDSGAVRRGLADPGRVVLLPLEAAGHLGLVDVDLEVGREIHQAGDDAWIAGVLVAHTYAHGLQLMFETREHWSAGGSALLLNLGGRWQLGDENALMVALGREVGPADPSRLGTLAYLGIQIHR